MCARGVLYNVSFTSPYQELQICVMQMVVDLFVQCGKPPPEDHAVVKIKPEPPVFLYNLWQPAEIEPA